MEELLFTIYYNELPHQSTWTSSTLLFTLTSSPISQHGRALLYYSHWRALPSVNMDKLFPTIHINEHFPSVNMDELYSTIYIDEHFPSVNMEELYSTIYFDKLSHKSTWTSSTLLFTLTSSPICQHGRALLCFSH